MPTLGWERAYRSGDLVRVRSRGPGLPGPRRRPGEGRRPAHRARRDRVGAAGAARRQRARPPRCAGRRRATRCSSATSRSPTGSTARAARARLAEELPAALVPLLAVVDELPTRTSGKVDRAALPWPLPGVEPDAAGPRGIRSLARRAVAGGARGPGLGAGRELLRPRRRIARGRAARQPHPDPRPGVHRRRHLRPPPPRRDGRRARRPGARAGIGARRPSGSPIPTPRGTQWVQTLVGVPLFILSGVRWLLYLLTATTILDALSDGFDFLPTVPLWVLARRPRDLRHAVRPHGDRDRRVRGSCSPGCEPGDYPRGGAVHLRMWLADQIAHQVDAVGLAGRPVGVVLRPRARREDRRGRRPAHAAAGHRHADDRRPRRDRARGRPRRHWIDGDVVRIGRVRIGAGSTIGARSTLLPGARIGKGAEIAPGSAVFGRVPAGQRWAGSPAERVGPAAPDPRSRRPGARAGSSRTARPRSSSRSCRSPRSRPAARSSPPGMAGADTLGEAALRALALAGPGHARRRASSSPASSCSPCGCSRSGCTRGGIRCAAASAGRRGRSSDCSTPRARSSSRCTRACSRPSGSGCSAPRWDAMSRRPRCCSSRR